MKPGAIFANFARGPIHDEAALVDALERGPLRAAALDVYQHEPKINPGLLRLAKTGRVMLLPHLGSATETARSQMATIALRNAARAMRGRRPPNAVNEI